MSNITPKADDAIIVKSSRLACDGGGGALGHPKTWLDMGQGSQVQCKYCDQIFRLDPNVSGHAH